VECFENRTAAAGAAATALADALRARLAADARAAIAVSGGTTPAETFGLLAAETLPWERVQVTLTDERRVPVDDPASNEGMLGRTLLTNGASAAAFVPLDTDSLAALPDRFAAVLVGMGEDGHFASIFPDAPELPELLDPDAPESCREVRTAASPHPRTTLSFARLLASDVVVLLAFGEAKRAVLEAPGDRPVATLLHQTRTPVRVLWAA
jgi:6-phosphogluconolactonase